MRNIVRSARIAGRWAVAERRLVLPVAIRRYRDGDRSEVHDLVAAGLEELGFALDAILDADLADPAGAYLAVWVAAEAAPGADPGDPSGPVVGSVAVRAFAGAHDDEPGRVAELKRMFLRPDYRGHGLGRQLLEVAISWAREAGFDWLRLDTGSAMVAAQRFYAANGFERCGSRVEAGAGEERCEVLYRRRLR
jgi:GNAT superfamily N-acetyltransferase